eukprot:6185410-Pleurochrysis_carterae.AAC.1
MHRVRALTHTHAHRSHLKRASCLPHALEHILTNIGVLLHRGALLPARARGTHAFPRPRTTHNILRTAYRTSAHVSRANTSASLTLTQTGPLAHSLAAIHPPLQTPTHALTQRRTIHTGERTHPPPLCTKLKGPHTPLLSTALHTTHRFVSSNQRPDHSNPPPEKDSQAC